MKGSTKACLSGLALSLAAMSASAQQVGVGQAEFESSCASCHGLDGKGGGPYAELLTVSVPDLTRLQASNGGVFPFERVYQVIDGREEVRAHGPRDMPIWGDRYNADALEMGLVGEMMMGREAYTRSRILALIAYLSTLQETEE
ncbi:c-type cytochrome [Halomonas beimenensis]|uniref:Cytochrome c, mono-and diheme variants n=1 Tax=Halomonas beimenensis TaxID=475662 RepID=A0A291P4Y5_9GAMM|nr:cytochrome c [Halomonas beimenensis]ATJ81931.1 cytochrome c, mono- and diheme variants [Halomonas beimenensis]